MTQFADRERLGFGTECEQAVAAWWDENKVSHARMDLDQPAFDSIRACGWSVPTGTCLLPEYLAWSIRRPPCLVDVKASEFIEERVLMRAPRFQAVLDAFMFFVVAKPIAKPDEWGIIRADLMRDFVENGTAEPVQMRQSGDKGYLVPKHHLDTIKHAEFWR